MGASTPKDAVVPVEATLLVISLATVVARLLVRLKHQHQSLTVCDWLLVASMAVAAALFTTDMMVYKLGGLGPYPTSVADQISLKKLNFAGNYFYDTGVYFPKLALCALYFKLIPPTMPKLRKTMYAVSMLTLVFAVITCLLDTFWCGADPSINWSLEEGACSTYNSKEVFRVDWVMNIVSDVAIFSLPFPLLKGLQLSRRYIIGVAAIFSAGIITVAASVSRFATVEVIHNWPNVYILSMTEMAAAIIVVSLPALKPLLRRRGERSTGHYGQYASGTAGRSSNKSGHARLASGRDPYVVSTSVAAAEDSGSEVELNQLGRANVIYKTARVSVTYQSREDAEGGGRQSTLKY